MRRAQGLHHRTAVLAPALTKSAILEGIRLRRVYATQDKNLQIWFSINGKPLGSIIPVPANTPLQIKVTIDDKDEPNAKYRVSLRRDAVGGELEAEDELAGLDRIGNGEVVFDQFQHTTADEYFLVQVVQTGGDGADISWTAPIWVETGGGTIDEHPSDDADPDTDTPMHPEEFVWSQNSEVYHLAQCRVVQQIAPQNRRAGHQAPTGKRLHAGCPQ
jgi:hypothetical protein